MPNLPSPNKNASPRVVHPNAETTPGFTADLELLAEGLRWPEGPTVLPDGSIAFVEAAGGRISRWDGQSVTLIAHVGGAPNAVVRGDDDLLYFTQNGGVVDDWVAPDPQPPGIWRVAITGGPIEPVVTRVDGQALLRPNDLAFSPDGALYFTDPGGKYSPQGDILDGAVYRIATNRPCTRLVSTGHTFVNGIQVGNNGQIWWTETYSRAVRRWQPETGSGVLVATLEEGATPDGFARAGGDTLLVCCGRTIEVLTQDGSVTGRILFPDDAHVTNCVFDGEDLYVTDGGRFDSPAQGPARGRLWRVRMSGLVGEPEVRGNV